MKRLEKHKTMLLALLVMILWGSLFPMVKIGYTAFEVSATGDILLFAGIRFIICGSAISLYAFKRDHNMVSSLKGSFLPVLLSGIFAIILHYSFTYLGLEVTDSSKTALLKQIGILFYVCFSFLFFKEDKVSAKKIIAALIGFTGIIILNLSTEGLSFSVGDLLILCASFCTVFSNVISKKVFQKVHPITVTGVSQLFGGIVLLFIGFLLGGSVRFTWNSGLLIMVYICCASIVSYCLWYGIVKNGELSRLFIIKFAEPVFACIFGALLLGEKIWTMQYLISFLLISGSIWMANTKKE